MPHEGVASVTVGNFTSIADNVTVLFLENHRPDWVSMFPFPKVGGWGADNIDGHPKEMGPIEIGSDVWIGRETRLYGGAEIGHGAMVGANSVVRGKVRPYARVRGNPAREMGPRRFDDETVERLLAVAWWDWDDDRVREFIPLLCSPDMGAFLEAAEG